MAAPTGVEAIVYVDHSKVREGAIEELKAVTRELADFVEANEPQLIAYNIYLSDDGTQISVVHVHLNSASLEYHMEVAGPLFRKLADLVTLSSIDIYGRPSERALKQLREKAGLLGHGTVKLHGLHAGFSRFGAR